MEVPRSLLDILEKGLYFQSVLKTKIVEFSRFWNNIGRISSLTRCDGSEEDREEFIVLLWELYEKLDKLESELGESHLYQLGTSHRRLAELYQCGECNHQIPIDFGCDVWSSLQNHEHFEALYIKLLNRSSQIKIETQDGSEPRKENETIPSTSFVDFDVGRKENTDTETAQCEVNVNEENIFFPRKNEEYRSNNPRFNFKSQYDSIVEFKIYPLSIVRAVQTIDKVSEYSILRAGPLRGVCLVCCCDLIFRSKVPKTTILDHVVGKRHSKCSRNPKWLNALQAYHKAFTNLDVSYQGHQVYFRPVTNLEAKCSLCNMGIKYTMITNHILTEKHRCIVLDLFVNRSSLYYLTNVQVLPYGFTDEVDFTQEEERIAAERELIK